MKRRGLWFCSTISLLLSACGSASVKYSNFTPARDPAKQRPALEAVSEGAQTVVLPNSRLIILVSRNSGNTGQPAPVPEDQPKPPPGGASGHPKPKQKLKPKQKTVTPSPAAAPGVVAIAGGAGQPALLPSGPAADAQQHDDPKASTPTPPSDVTVNLVSADNSIAYAVSVVPVEGDTSFLVTPKNDLFSKNDLGITRLANTRIPTTVSNTFTDETASDAKALAGVVTSVMTGIGASAAVPGFKPSITGEKAAKACLSTEEVVVARASSTPPPPTANDPTTWLGGSANPPGSSSECLGVTIEKTSTAPNLVPIDVLHDYVDHENPMLATVWPVPACMTVVVTIRKGPGPKETKDDGKDNGKDDGTVASGTMTLIDPDYVELMPLPKSGKIAMHPVCGADLVDTATDKYQAVFDTITAITAALPTKGGKTAATTKPATPPGAASPTPGKGKTP